MQAPDAQVSMGSMMFLQSCDCSWEASLASLRVSSGRRTRTPLYNFSLVVYDWRSCGGCRAVLLAELFHFSLVDLSQSHGGGTQVFGLSQSASRQTLLYTSQPAAATEPRGHTDWTVECPVGDCCPACIQVGERRMVVMPDPVYNTHPVLVY